MIKVNRTPEELKKELMELERVALRKVAKEFRKELKAVVPKDTGNLEKNIATWVKIRESKLEIGIYTPSSSKKKKLSPAFYGLFFETGIDIPPGKKYNYSKRAKSKKMSYRNGYKRAPQPFMIPTAEKLMPKIQEIFKETLPHIKNDTKNLIDESEEITNG